MAPFFFKQATSLLTRNILAQLDRLALSFLLGHRDTHLDVDGFNGQGERHGEVHVAFWHMDVERIGNQHGTDHDQERQRQHLQRRMLLDEVADGEIGRASCRERVF